MAMEYHTCELINNLPEPVVQVANGYSASVKNIYNPTLFLMYALIACYDYVQEQSTNDKNKNYSQDTSDLNQGKSYYVLKENHDKQALNLFNFTINKLNQNKLDKLNKADVKKSKEKKEIVLSDKNKKNNSEETTEIKLYQAYDQIIDSSIFYQFLNSTLLINTLKEKERINIEYRDYLENPSHIANYAVNLAIGDYKNYLASLKSYRLDNSQFNGLPQRPKFKKKDARCAYMLDKGCLTKEGYIARVITEDNILTFGSIKDKKNINKIYQNPDKKELLNSDDIKSYNNFSFTKSINLCIATVQSRTDKDLAKFNDFYVLNQNPDELNPTKKIKVDFTGLKFVPNENYVQRGLPAMSVYAVLKHGVESTPGSLYDTILSNHQKFFELSDSQKLAHIAKHYKNHDLDKRIASIDLGVVNHASLAFNYNKPGELISGHKYNNYVKNKNLILDGIKSKLLPEALKEIQSNYDQNLDLYEVEKQKFIQNIKDTNSSLKDNDLNALIEEELLNNFKEIKPTLSSQGKALMKSYYQSLYKNLDYVSVLNKLNHYKKNYLHQISDKIMNLCAMERINYLIIGKNDGWKNGINIGRDNNQKTYNIAHSDLINLLKYKAFKYGIVLLVTEESYTSKTSFMNNIELKNYRDKKIEVLNTVKKKNNRKPKPDNVNATVNNQNIIESKENQEMLSKNALPEKSKFDFGGRRVTRSEYINNVSKIKIHADINACFNIIRKVFQNFKYHSDLSIEYKIVFLMSHKRHFKIF